jgi:hypothetical protein
MFSMRHNVSLAAVFAFANIAAAQPTQDGKATAICDVLHQPSAYNGRVVAIRGGYFVGGHGLYLKGEDCDGALVTKGYRWPSLIWIVNTVEEMQRRGRTLDQYMRAVLAVDEATQRELLSARAGTRVRSVTVTYIGLFETYENLEASVVRRPDGSVIGFGFGQVPGAPGQLFVDSIKDITVELEPAPPRR